MYIKDIYLFIYIRIYIGDGVAEEAFGGDGGGGGGGGGVEEAVKGDVYI
jgi:hypothetical protein